MDNILTNNVAIVANGIRSPDLAIIIESFKCRYHFRYANGIDILVIKEVTYLEFISLLLIIQKSYICKMMYRYAESDNMKHKFPHEDIFIYRG